MAITEEDVIAHFGVRGMKWGQRKQERADRRDSRRKPIVVREQTAIKVGGYATTLIGARVVSRVAAQRGGTAMGLLAGGATLAIGHQLTQSAAARYGDHQMSEFQARGVIPVGDRSKTT